MVDPFQVATQGLGPGFTTFNIATMGFGFEINVLPVTPKNKGGTLWQPLNAGYDIVVKIKYKEHEWEDTYGVSKWFGETVINVVAKYKGFRIADVGIAVRKFLVNKITPIVSVFKKKDD